MMILIYSILFIFLLFYLSFEYQHLNSIIRKIPLRILVNGTRGKTTTIKILYQTLRESGYNVYAKTTGEQPVEYYPDGSRKILNRIAPASIIENVRILKKMSKLKPDVIIMECMALHPENQHILTHKIFKPTHLLLTNVLHDHFEEMGETIETIFNTMQQSFSKRAKILLPENLKTISIPEYQTEYYPDSILKSNLENIPDTIINNSWGLISQTCDVLNLDKNTAQSQFTDVWHKINTYIRIKNMVRGFEFWNLFSVNDYDSTVIFIEYILSRISVDKNTEIILNTRADRPLRSKIFASLISDYFSDNKIYLCGGGTELTRHLLNKLCCNNIEVIPGAKVISVFDRDFEQFTTILGLGNFKGMANLITQIQSPKPEESA